MKSRLAVSLAFILIGVSFTSHNTAGLAKLRSRTHKFCGRYPVQVCNCLTARDSALMSAIRCNNKDEVKMNHLDGEKSLRTCPPAVHQPRLKGPISPADQSIDFDSALICITPVHDRGRQTTLSRIRPKEPGDKPMHAHMDLPRAQ